MVGKWLGIGTSPTATSRGRHDQAITLHQPVGTAFRRQSTAAPIGGLDLKARKRARQAPRDPHSRSEEHTSELQSLMRISYAVFCLKKKKKTHKYRTSHTQY